VTVIACRRGRIWWIGYYRDGQLYRESAGTSRTEAKARVSKGKVGQAISDFRGLWKTALAAATLSPGLLPYDLRRSAVRNLIRAAVHETVAMKISGHRTRSTFDRYNIGSVDDLRDAVRKVAAYVDAQPTERNVERLERSQNPHNRKAR